MKLSDILRVVKTYQKIQFEFNSGERCFMCYEDVFEYLSYYVAEIWTDGNVLVIKLSNEEEAI